MVFRGCGERFRRISDGTKASRADEGVHPTLDPSRVVMHAAERDTTLPYRR